MRYDKHTDLHNSKLYMKQYNPCLNVICDRNTLCHVTGLTLCPGVIAETTIRLYSQLQFLSKDGRFICVSLTRCLWYQVPVTPGACGTRCLRHKDALQKTTTIARMLYIYTHILLTVELLSHPFYISMTIK